MGLMWGLFSVIIASVAQLSLGFAASHLPPMTHLWDLLSPLQNALYCINREKLHTVKVLSASSYSPDEWERQCKVARKTQ